MVLAQSLFECLKGCLIVDVSGRCEMMPGLSCKAKQTSLALCDVQEQGNSDSTLDDVACLLGCTRSSLHGETSFV